MGETIKMTGLAEGQIRPLKLKPQFFLLQNHQQAEVVTWCWVNGVTHCLLCSHEIGVIYCEHYTWQCSHIGMKRGRNAQWASRPQPGCAVSTLLPWVCLFRCHSLLLRQVKMNSTLENEENLTLLLLRWNMILTAKWLVYTVSWVTWQIESEFWNKNHTIISLRHNPYANLIRTSSKSSSLPGTLSLWGSF